MNKIIGLLISIIMVSCGPGKCEEGSDAVKLARSFSESEYANMFAAMEELKRISPQVPIYPVDGNFEIPSALQALNPKKISIERKSPGVNLEGCFDHYVIMIFHGLNSDTGTISLTWGEGPTAGSQELWRRSR